jgi:hypothetical protein
LLLTPLLCDAHPAAAIRMGAVAAQGTMVLTIIIMARFVSAL